EDEVPWQIVGRHKVIRFLPVCRSSDHNRGFTLPNLLVNTTRPLAGNSAEPVRDLHGHKACRRYFDRSRVSARRTSDGLYASQLVERLSPREDLASQDAV